MVQNEKITRLQALLKQEGAPACLVCSNSNLYYFTGRVYAGFLYVPCEGEAAVLQKRPAGFEDGALSVKGPWQIAAALKEAGCALPDKIWAEDEALSKKEWDGLEKALGATLMPMGEKLRLLRAVKTGEEIEKIKNGARRHDEVYAKIPHLYRPGMTDLEFSAEIEYVSRKMGHLGIFRTFGGPMEIYMGSVLCGANADAVSPYDFALGGAGLDASFPISVCGRKMNGGESVMVDMSGNFTGYLTDMSRTFSIGALPDEAYEAHKVSIEICETLSRFGPGETCGRVYAAALAIASRYGLEKHFMGFTRRSKFVGHSLGIEINELPVLYPKNAALLAENMVLAIEPKFVFPEFGAVGVENTYLVTKSGMEKLTNACEDIIDLTK